MWFLVIIDGTNVRAEMPQERIVQVREQMVVTGVGQLAQWEREGRIHGRGFTHASGRGLPPFTDTNPVALLS